MEWNNNYFKENVIELMIDVIKQWEFREYAVNLA